jgi:hypothetical protein
MAVEAITTGSITIRDWDSNRILSTIDYFPIDTTMVALPWTDPTATPLVDLRVAMRGVSSACNQIPTLVAMGARASEAFENNPSVVDAFSHFWVKPGELTPEMVNWGVTSMGTYRGVPLYSYDAMFTDKNNNAAPYLPVDCVLVACTQNPGRFAYAGIGQVNDQETNLVVVAGRRVPLVWFPDDADMRKVRLASVMSLNSL